MFQAWLSIGYIVLLAILVFAFILWRRGVPVLAIAALVVGIPYGWIGIRTSNMDNRPRRRNEVRRSDPDAAGDTTDIEYIYMRDRSDRGLELINEDPGGREAHQRARLQRRQDRAARNTEMTSCGMASTLFSGNPM